MACKKIKSYSKVLGVSVAFFAGFLANPSFSFTLGDIRLESALNEPLIASIELLELDGLSESQVIVSLGSPADFERVGVESLPLLNRLQFDVEILSSSEGLVHITSSELVVEPYLNFVLNVRWPAGRIIREYTVLLDLPTFSSSQAPAPSPTQLSATSQQEPAPAPRPAAPAPEPVPIADPIEQIIATPEPVQEASPAEPAPVIAEEAPVAPAPALRPEPEPEMENSSPETVVIQTGDSLWNIALATRPDSSVSIQQMMIAIQRTNSNSDAFIAGNINGIRAGRVLRIPSREEIFEIGQDQALSQVSMQNRQFSGSAQPLAVNNTRTDLNSEGRDELSLVTELDSDTESEQVSSLNQTIRTLENELSLSEENLDRARLENEELVSRLEDMEEEIAILENIIAIEAERMAELQNQIATQAEAAESTAAALSEAEVPSAVQSNDLSGNESSVSTVSSVSGGSNEGIVEKLLGSTIGLIAALVVLLGVIVGFLIIRNRNAVKDHAELDSGIDDITPSDFESGFSSSETENSDDSLESDFGDKDDDISSELSSLDEEFDLGIDDDAEKELEEDSNEETNEETNEEIEEETLNEFVESDSKDSEESFDFEEDEASDDEDLDPLYDEEDDEEDEDEGDDEEEEDLEETENLGFFASLFARFRKNKDQEDEEDEDHDEEDELDLGDDEEIEEDIEDIDEGEDSSDEEELAASTLADSTDSTESTDNTDNTDDSDLTEDLISFDDEDLESSDEEDEDEAEEASDLESFEFTPAVEPVATIDPTDEVTGDDKESEELETVSFDDISLEPSDTEPGDSVIELDSQTDELGEIEFIDSDDDEVIEIVESPEDSGRENESSPSLGSLGLADSFLTDDSDEDEIEVITDQDEVATKLDLAVAYHAMEDLEGAKEILDEVIAEGSEEQVAEARKMLYEWGAS